METRLFANWVTGDKQGRHVGRAGPGRLREEPQPPADTLRPLLGSLLLSASFSLCIPFIYFYIFTYLSWWGYMSHSVLVEVTGQFVGTGSLLPPQGLWEMNSGPQAWQQGPLSNLPEFPFYTALSSSAMPVP